MSTNSIYLRIGYYIEISLNMVFGFIYGIDMPFKNY